MDKSCSDCPVRAIRSSLPAMVNADEASFRLIAQGPISGGIQKDGSRIRMVIRDVSDDKVTLDANHPLAGKDLVFDIELVEIVGQN